MAPARTGSVRQRGSRWQARLQRPDGTTTSATFRTRREAERWVRDAAGEAARPAAGPAAMRADGADRTPTFAQWALIWQADATAHLRVSSKARAASAMRAHLLPAFGQRRLDEITAAEVRRWMAGLVADGLTPATATRLLRVLGACLQVAADDGLIAANPARGVRPPQTERHEQRYLNPGEVARLADAIDSRYRALIYLAAYGGLRIGEIAALSVGAVNLTTGTVQITRQVVEVAGHQHTGPPKTAAGRRTVTLPRFVADQLAPHLAGKTPDTLVFAAPEGGTLRRSLFAARYFRPAVDKAGLAPLRVHDLRHTAVALWVAAGASPLELTRRAGHSSASFVLDRYGHLYAEGFQATTDRLEAMAVGAG